MSLLNQSTIYQRHHARLGRTYALRDDSRPAVIRVLSGLPLCRMVIPPFEPSSMSSSAASIVSLHESSKSAQHEFSDNTIYSTGNSVSSTDHKSASVAPLVVLAAGLSGGAAEYVFGPRGSSLPQSWAGSWTRAAATGSSRASILVNHDILSFHQHHQALPSGKGGRYFDLAPYERGVANNAILSTAGLSALLFGTKAFAAEKFDSEESSIISSAIAGVAVATVGTPLHAIQTQSALQKAAGIFGSTTFAGSAASLVHNQGISSLFRSASVVYPREMVGATLYFGCYEAVKASLFPESASRGAAPSFAVATAGATAGALYRGFVHLTDTLLLANSYGMHATRGFASTILRAAPANAVLFLGYEAAIAAMSDHNS